jgi:6-phospho-beta-glucosidase
VKPKFAILGGSSPFTVALVDALAAAHPAVPTGNICLFGRSLDNLDCVGRYATRHLAPLGWRVFTSTELAEALDGADVVLHQIRYGGMAGRARDEAFAVSHGIPADETLGPAGLISAFRTAPGVHDLARRLLQYCPDCWVLNLTNPLSLATALISRAGLRCVGLCELPRVTLHEACRVLGVPAGEVDWSYTGLNHRGFICRLERQRQNLLTDLPRRLGPRTIGGIPATVIAQLSAIPLKYFALLNGGAPKTAPRAVFLTKLQQDILYELRQSVERSPPSLALRDLAWYPEAVVPMLAAIFANDGRVEVVNALNGDHLVVERRARIFSDRWEVLPEPPYSAAVRHWLELFEAHERACLQALLVGKPEDILGALSADPLVPADRAEPLAREISQLLPLLCDSSDGRTRG